MNSKIKWHESEEDVIGQTVYVDEDGNEVSPDSQFEAIEEVIESSRPTPPKQQTQVRRKAQTEALRRIQKAKLYEVLITHDLIGQGSADDEIIEEVQDEIQQFFSARLDFLLGLSADGQPAIAPAVQLKSSFSEEQTNALIALANRIVEKSATQEKQPTVKPLQASKQDHSQDAVRYQAGPLKPQVQQKAQTVVNKVVKVQVTKPQSQSAAVKKVVKVKRTQSGRRNGQIVDKNRPPVKMPSQSEWDMLNARQVQKNASGTDDLVGKAIGLAQQNNASIKEDLGPTE